MPWHIESDHEGCSGFAVVKDDDGSVAGCHDTHQDAMDQMAALYANEDDRAKRTRQREHSSFVAPLSGIEWRDSGNGEDFTLTGHAAVFDHWSEELWTFAGTFREKVKRGAFSDALGRKPDVRLYYNHDGLTLARTNAKTLELSEDEVGLRVWARVAPTQFARDLRMAMQRGDVDQMSFAFTVAEDEWREDQDEETVERTIVRVQDLYDVSIVAEPAYPDTDATMRELRAAAKAGKIHPPSENPIRISGTIAPDFVRTSVNDTLTVAGWPGQTYTLNLGASTATDSTVTDTSREAGGVSGPHPRLVALRARSRRARLLTPEKGS